MPHANLALTTLFALLGPVYLLAVSWPLAVTDIREYRLPNRLVLPGFGFALVGQLVALSFGNWQLLQALALSLATFALGFFANSRGFLGMGDVKLATLISLNLGWFAALQAALALVVALALAGAVALAAAAFGRNVYGTRIALGPYLLAGFGLELIQVLATGVGGS
ncbi:MAG: A24 family peptidase [Actinomycetes bacterium]